VPKRDEVEEVMRLRRLIAFSSEVDTGSREENATLQSIRAPALIPSKPEKL